MSFHTIFVVIPKEGKVWVSPHLDASESLAYFRRVGMVGELYACLCSTGTAVSVRETGNLSTLKQFSHSMMKVGDVT